MARHNKKVKATLGMTADPISMASIPPRRRHAEPLPEAIEPEKMRFRFLPLWILWLCLFVTYVYIWLLKNNLL